MRIDPGTLLSELQVGIIKRKFASIGRGVNGDMAQLLKHLRLLRVAAAWQKQADNLAAINAFPQGLTENYRCRSHALSAPWLAESAYSAPEATSLTARLMRFPFLAHRADMIKNSFLEDWVCTSHRSCGGQADPSSGRERLVVLVSRRRAGGEFRRWESDMNSEMNTSTS